MYEIKEFTRENIPAVLAFERELRQECKARGAGIIIALTARNDEAQRFYQSVEAHPSTTPASGSTPDVNSAKRGSQI